MTALRSLIFNDPPPKTRADYRHLSDRDLWTAFYKEGNHQEAAIDDDTEYFAATAALNSIRLEMEARGLLHWRMVRL
jgi:hypothetical protein